MRLPLVALVLALAGLLAVDLEPSAAPRVLAAAPLRAKQKPAPEAVRVAFVKNGRIRRVERVVPKGLPPAEHALRELVQGPTRAERRRDLRTAFRDGSRVRSVRTDGALWYVSLSRSAFGAGSPETQRARLWQIAATLAPLGPQEHVVVATEGRVVSTVRLGVRPGRWRGEVGENGYRYEVRGVQLRLWTLGYLDRSDVTGSADYLTQQALLAFQGWEGIERTGTVTGSTQVALFRATRPRPRQRGASGRRIEIHLDQAALLVVEDREVVRVVHTSTGAGGTTPRGEFRVYAKSLMSWSVPFRVWMPFAAYFRGGIAMHQSPDVPPYPASHGCVRLPEGEAERVYRFVEIETPVTVF